LCWKKNGDIDYQFQVDSPQDIIEDHNCENYLITTEKQYSQIDSAVSIYSKQGTLIAQLEYEFLVPYGVDVDAVGNFVVADFNSGILLFDNSRKFVKKMECKPIAVAIDIDGNIVAATAGGNHSILVFSAKNSELGKWMKWHCECS